MPEATTIASRVLETLVRDVVSEQLVVNRIVERGPLGRTLGLSGTAFPARQLPDIVISMDGKFFICEVKSSRVDYSRFDCVFESLPFKGYLVAQGHDGPAPWEVEQDLIRLRLFAGLTDAVQSCLFLMVDAYAGKGRSWASVFSDLDTFKSTMRTHLVRGWSTELLASTMIESIATPQLEARLIVCEVRPTHDASAV